MYINRKIQELQDCFRNEVNRITQELVVYKKNVFVDFPIVKSNFFEKCYAIINLKLPLVYCKIILF